MLQTSILSSHIAMHCSLMRVYCALSTLSYCHYCYECLLLPLPVWCFFFCIVYLSNTSVFFEVPWKKLHPSVIQGSPKVPKNSHCEIYRLVPNAEYIQALILLPPCRVQCQAELQGQTEGPAKSPTKARSGIYINNPYQGLANIWMTERC